MERSIFEMELTSKEFVYNGCHCLIFFLRLFSLKDCTKGIKKIVELVQLMTREMERKVHEEGRKARRRDAIGKQAKILKEVSLLRSSV